MNTVPNEIDHQFERSKRLSSNSKKKTLNRIQMYDPLLLRYSKASDQSQNMHLNSIIKSQQLYSN